MDNIQVLANTLKFLERVKDISGVEAYAWVEVHNAIQNRITQLAQEKLSTPAVITTNE